MLRAAVMRGAGQQKKKISRTPRTLSTAVPRFGSVASKPLSSGDGDFETHLRTNFEVPETALDRDQGICIITGQLLGIEQMDNMSVGSDAQLFLTNRTPRELGVQAIADALFEADHGAMILEYYVKLVTRIAAGASLDPVVVGLATWVSAELGYARHVVPFTSPGEEGERVYNLEALGALQREGVIPDRVPGSKGGTITNPARMFARFPDGFYPDPADPTHAGYKTFWGRSPVVNTAIYENRIHQQATMADVHNLISAQATRAGLRTHTLGQFSQAGEREVTSVHDSIVESAAMAAGLSSLSDPIMRNAFRDLSSLVLWEELMFAQEALRVCGSNQVSKQYVFVMATRSEKNHLPDYSGGLSSWIVIPVAPVDCPRRDGGLATMRNCYRSMGYAYTLISEGAEVLFGALQTSIKNLLTSTQHILPFKYALHPETIALLRQSSSGSELKGLLDTIGLQAHRDAVDILCGT